jgi:hydrogenase nickel incorporation protein HypB
MMRVTVQRDILSANDAVAADNRALFDEVGVLAVNVMASPGAGKTSLILATAARLPEEVRLGVVEGDLASRIDTDTVAAQGIPVTQINTGGSCHLDAPMVQAALADLPVRELDLLFIENVGNLICTAEFDLGAHMAVVVASVPEGHDKPYKYPNMFARADIVLLNKSDLLAVFDFDLESFRRGVEMVNPEAPIITASCRSGMGMDAWLAWLLSQRSVSRG